MPSLRFASHRRRGFTLLELSIVLVIIGLIVGGILAGQEMIRASELQRVIKEKDKVFVATESFRLKFLQLPGDFSKATDFWGVNASSCPNGSSLTGSCNGNGNSQVDWVGWASQSEAYRYWQHLALGGMYPGQFTGAVVSGTNIEAGKNVPAIPSGGFWLVMYLADGQASIFNKSGNALVAFGAGAGAAVFTPEDAWRIDKKADDGMPATGKVTSSNDAWTPNCTTNTTVAAEYKVAEKGITCPLYFWLNQ